MLLLYVNYISKIFYNSFINDEKIIKTRYKVRRYCPSVLLFTKNEISTLYNIIKFMNTDLVRNSLYCEKFLLSNSMLPIGPSLKI